ncbi:MAG TPA: DUF3108 domain-containing protein [Steroidobacteraceae bacterium]|jgi:hypothetical protein|nr:DUF3108 domain-containing protein [Steroidobacteraceae bacterium]
MRLPERMRRALLCGALLAAGAVAHADPIDLKPYKASYTLEWKGITAGSSTLELKSLGGDRYTFGASAAARGIFRMAFSDAVTQTSTFRVVDGKVIPQAFNGMDDKERPTGLVFDWTRRRVTGTAKGHAVDLELPDGAQDPMSLQIASLRALANGALQDRVWLIDTDKLKEYELQREGTERIETALGTVDTILYTSRRAAGDRVTRTWVAPALGYLPVKAQRLRGKKVEFTMLIESLEQ